MKLVCTIFTVPVHDIHEVSRAQWFQITESFIGEGGGHWCHRHQGWMWPIKRGRDSHLAGIWWRVVAAKCGCRSWVVKAKLDMVLYCLGSSRNQRREKVMASQGERNPLFSTSTAAARWKRRRRCRHWMVSPYQKK